MLKTRCLHAIFNLVMVLVICGLLSSCVGTVIGAVVDTTIEVVKIPFKVAGAVIDVATPNKKESKDSTSEQDDDEKDL